MTQEGTEGLVGKGVTETRREWRKRDELYGRWEERWTGLPWRVWVERVVVSLGETGVGDT